MIYRDFKLMIIFKKLNFLKTIYLKSYNLY